MKTVAIGLLFMGGILAAQDQTAQEEASPEQSQHVSYFDRIALRTQSPPVKMHAKHSNKPSKYIVTENKTTIVAVRPFEPNNK